MTKVIHRATIVDLIDKHKNYTTTNPEHIKFKVRIGEKAYEDILAYNETLERLEADEENLTIWRFKRIVGHLRVRSAR